MKKRLALLILIALLSLTVLAGCGRSTPTEVVTAPITNPALTSWITEPVKATQSDLTLEVLHVTQKEGDLILRVRFPLVDWRNWYISKVTLTIVGGESYQNAQTDFFERLYQKAPGKYCLYQPSYNETERCLESEGMETYQIDELIFRDLPGDLEEKEIVVEILELSTQPTIDSESYCDDLRLPYIEGVVSKDFPGLTLECNEGSVSISESSEFATDVDALAAVKALVVEAGSGVIAGPWRFEIRK